MMRDYYYELSNRGVLTLDGAVQDDPWFLDFFFRRLAPTANPEYPEYPFVCRCGDEMNYLHAADTPIVYNGYDGTRLLYGYSLSTPFYPERLSYSADGILYHWATVGERGRIVPHVALELAQRIEPWGPFFAIADPDTSQRIPITPLGLEENLEFLRPKRDNHCVGCGLANPHSLRLTFLYDRDHGIVRTWLRPDERMCGALGTTHGGFVSLLLDETMGKALSAAGIRAPTARLAVNFRRPMTLGQEYEIQAQITSQQGRKKFVSADIRLASDPVDVIADAEALFVEMKPPKS